MGLSTIQYNTYNHFVIFIAFKQKVSFKSFLDAVAHAFNQLCLACQCMDRFP